MITRETLSRSCHEVGALDRMIWEHSRGFLTIGGVTWDTTVTPAKRYLKFGVLVKSASGNLVAGRVRLRIEFRA